MLQAFDREAVREQYRNARPFPFVKIDNFLDAAAAREIAASYPSFDNAAQQGITFKTVNERRKVQVTDAKLFPEPVSRLNDLLASKQFLADLSYITGIKSLLADDELVGGGMHITGPGGRLDVHLDFNYIEDRRLHRRLNLLLYLNPTWDDDWGGHIQLWDTDVKVCHHDYAPVFNRCVVFETSDVSYHGVTPVTKDAPFPRQSFATYYYTKEAPAHWKGVSHSTIFKARPGEHMRAYVLMPGEELQRRFIGAVRQVKQGFKRLIRQ